MTMCPLRSSYTMEQLRLKPELLGDLSAEAQTEALCLAAVRLNRRALHYTHRQTPAICLSAVHCDGYALEYVRQQTPEICLAAVRQEGLALKYVKDQTPEVCLAAVQQNGSAIGLVYEPTLTLCLAAIDQQGHNLEYVRMPQDQLHLASSGQLENWLTLMEACPSTDGDSISGTLRPLIVAIPLGKQYCDEWCQKTPSGVQLIDKLLVLTGELSRLAPADKAVMELKHRVNQQQEWILRRQLITSAEEGPVPLEPVEQDNTL